MSTESREHLSCLMDGEINRETGRFLVRRLGSDRELCATWARYHLVRDCLRNHEGGLAGSDLSGRVQRAIAGHEVRGARTSAARRARDWLRPAAGLAVAASVALLAIIAVGPGAGGVQPTADNPAALPVAESFTAPQALTPPPVSQQVSLAGSNRMNAYLLRHYQATGSTGGKGFVTFVPIVIRGSTAPVTAADGAAEAAPQADPEELDER